MIHPDSYQTIFIIFHPNYVPKRKRNCFITNVWTKCANTLVKLLILTSMHVFIPVELCFAVGVNVLVMAAKLRRISFENQISQNINCNLARQRAGGLVLQPYSGIHWQGPYVLSISSGSFGNGGIGFACRSGLFLRDGHLLLWRQ